MAKSSTRFEAHHPLDAFVADRPAAPKAPGVTVEIRRGHAMGNAFAISGEVTAVEKALKIKGTPGAATSSKDYSALPLSPGQWLLVSSAPADHGFGEKLTKRLKGSGYYSEQSDSRVIFRISGRNARELMIKGCRLDLHPSVAKAGFCAQTQMAQIGVLIHQVEDAPVYDLFVYSGFAQEFAEWLDHSSAQYGIRFK